MVRELVLAKKRDNSKKLRSTAVYQEYEKSYNKEYRKKPEVKKRKVINQICYERRNKFGITGQDYNDMKKAQDNKCAICETTIPGGRGDFHVDHDHKTGKIRALLCFPCNTGLGHFKDNPEFLEKAAFYLKQYL